MNSKNLVVVIPFHALLSLKEPPGTVFEFHRFYTKNNQVVIQDVDANKIFNQFGEIRVDVVKLAEKIDDYKYSPNNPMMMKSINRLIKQLL